MSHVFSLSKIQRTLSCPLQYHLNLVGGYRQLGKMIRAIREKSSNTFLPRHEGSDSVLAYYIRECSEVGITSVGENSPSG